MSRTMRLIACLAAYLLPVPVSFENGLEARGLICYAAGKDEKKDEKRDAEETKRVQQNSLR